MKIICTKKGFIFEDKYYLELINSNHSIYEVIRVIDGIAIFLEDHFIRLKQSMKIQQISFVMDYAEFKMNVNKLIHLNQIDEGNIKFVYAIYGRKGQWVFAFIPHSYPNFVDYEFGVTSDLLYAERENPNAKVIQNSVRDSANQMILEHKLYEVLLVNGNGLITEGSRSNVFFIRDEVFYTAPASLVLVGITRNKILECLKNLDYPIIEEAVKASEINQFEAVFLTGTSPKVLPVKSIGNLIYNTKLLHVKKLITKYNMVISQYIQKIKISDELYGLKTESEF